MTTDLIAQAEAVLAGVTKGRAVQFHPSYCKEAENTPFSERDTSHDLSVIRPDGTRYRIGTFRHADDAAFDQWCRAGVPALIARIRELEGERDAERKAKQELALDVLAASGQAQEAYEAQLAAEAKLAEVERERDGLNAHIEGVAKDTHALLVKSEATVASLKEQVEAMQKRIDDLTILDRAGDVTIAALNKQVEAMRGALEKIADGENWQANEARAALTTENQNG